MDERTKTYNGRKTAAADSKEHRVLALVAIWSADEQHLGEALLFPVGASYEVGRGEGEAGRAGFVRQRPGSNVAGTVIRSSFVSRRQLMVTASREHLEVVNCGKAALLDGDGRVLPKLTLRAGDVCEIEGQLLLLCVDRPFTLPPFQRGLPVPEFEFGQADSFGIVGESEQAWKLREHLAFLAARTAPVLILGPSGSGKEVAARAIHGGSTRRSRTLVARNAATLPAGLVEAELFGNLANYPNAGMPERPGLLGEAQGSTLFLDEIGELADEIQARLLRVLDTGDYQKLGDARQRKADVRMLAATNRSPEELRPDVAARFKLRLTLPGLDERREDLVLLLGALAQRAAVTDSVALAPFFSPARMVRCSLPLMRALCRHAYSTHVRELEALMWLSVRSSRGDSLELTPELKGELAARPAAITRELPDAATVRAAIERAGGVRERAWRELGLANRYVLKRLLKKYGIAADEPNNLDG